ncbi:hypothetical protein HMPREF1002_00580 [Porphyromonas sp. 31_2]|nr:hypothetical protein HMPREF1002_00580 [Porphyromonas sp. 31_2]
MKKTLIYIISVIGLFSCDLDEVPVSEVSKEPVFSTENGLELYANSFYEILPTPSAAHQADNMCDYAARALVPNFYIGGCLWSSTERWLGLGKASEHQLLYPELYGPTGIGKR